MNRLNKTIRRRKFLVIIPLVSFLSVIFLPFTENLAQVEAAEFGMSAEFLLQSGITFYDQGRFLDAVSEFQKALVVDPGSEVAKVFLRRIQNELSAEELVRKDGASKLSAIEEALDQTELKYRVLPKPTPETQQAPFLIKEASISRAALQEIERKPRVILAEPERIILLDEELRFTQPNTVLELNKDSSVLIKGDNIKRFLNIAPEKIAINRLDQDSLIITSQDVGKGIFHIWDNSGRWTFNFKGILPHFTLAFREEYELRKYEAQLAEPFKISYSFDWSSFHTGRRLDTTERQSININQSVTMRGETPYGKYNAWSGGSRINKEYQLDYLGMNLLDAHFWGLEHLNLSWFDFSPTFGAFKFPSADLRGFSINAPMFNDRINYTAFWGGLPEGNYSRLNSALGTTREAYLEGIGLQYRHSQNSKYKLYYANTYGSELSPPVLTNNNYGLGAFYRIGKLNFDSEIAYDDREHISYTSNARLTLSKMSMFLDFIEEDRDFVSALGGGPSGGSSSARFGVNLYPTGDLSLSNNFSLRRDRSLYNPDDPKRPNYTFDSDLSYRLDPFTTAEIGYSRIDNKGTVSPAMSETKRFNLRKQFFFIKKISSYFNYVNSRNKYYSGTSSNYDQNTLRAGLGFNIIGDLYWNINQSFNFTRHRITKEKATSHVLETGLSYYSRIFDSPFYGRLRITYRDEEDAGSALSFLSGEDRLEFSGELNYRPNPYVDAYLSGRVANIWAENEGRAKRLDAEVRCGMRLAWDTGFRWNTKGHVYGFVFYDLDGDSIKDQDEEGVEGVVINATAKKTDATNKNGFYLIKNIIGKKARVTIDMNSMPRGYNLTTPSYYDISIKHDATQRLDFGITTRSEVVGVIFIDTNGNNKFDRGEEGIDGVVIILDDFNRVATDQGGQYLFRKISPGEHDLKIDLKTLPTKYIPKVPLMKKFMLDEGATFFYHVPLRVSQQ